jgi:hypothetical protein
MGTHGAPSTKGLSDGGVRSGAGRGFLFGFGRLWGSRSSAERWCVAVCTKGLHASGSLLARDKHNGAGRPGHRRLHVSRGRPPEPMRLFRHGLLMWKRDCACVWCWRTRGCGAAVLAVGEARRGTEARTVGDAWGGFSPASPSVAHPRPPGAPITARRKGILRIAGEIPRAGERRRRRRRPGVLQASRPPGCLRRSRISTLSAVSG